MPVERPQEQAVVVSNATVAATSPKYAIVNTSNVNVRTAPSATAEKVAGYEDTPCQLQCGNVVEVLQSRGGWLKVAFANDYEKTTGWIMGKFTVRGGEEVGDKCNSIKVKYQGGVDAMIVKKMANGTYALSNNGTDVFKTGRLVDGNIILFKDKDTDASKFCDYNLVVLNGVVYFNCSF